MNDRSYWEKLGRDYEAEVFDVLANDGGGVVASRVRASAGARKDAGDFGCGVGRFLPLLSECFRSVRALDFSESCLRDGQGRFRDLDNVSFKHFDLRSTARACKPLDFILSVNALLAPELADQLAMFRTLARHLKPGGRMVLVTPSLESAMLAADRMVQWNLREGMSAREAAAEAASPRRKAELDIRADGVVRIEGAATKHYRREELIDRLRDAGLRVESIDRVEYDWDTEFQSPPEWMGEPCPWDWCVCARR